MAKQPSLVPFAVLYIIFLAPVVTSLWEDFRRPQPNDGILPLNCSFWGFVVWISLLHALFFGLRFVCRVLNWKMNAKSPAALREDVRRLGATGASIAVIGRATERCADPRVGPLFVLLIVYYTAFYSVIFEMVKHHNIELNAGGARNPTAVAIVGSAAMVTVAVFVSLFTHLLQEGEHMSQFFLYCAMVLVYHMALFFAPSSGKSHTSGATHLHVHHWYWAFVISHLPVVDTRVALISQAIFVAVYIHGIACFGAEQIFYDGEEWAARLLADARRDSMLSGAALAEAAHDAASQHVGNGGPRSPPSPRSPRAPVPDAIAEKSRLLGGHDEHAAV